MYPMSSRMSTKRPFQDLVPVLVEELDPDVVESSVLVELLDPAYALAIGADGILCTGDDEHRKDLGDLLRLRRIIGKFDAGQQIDEELRGAHEAAQRIVEVLVDLGLVTGQPVAVRPVGSEVPVVAPE